MSFLGQRRAEIREFLRYFLISVVALAVDVGVLMAGARMIQYLWAASLGFLSGMAVSYALAVVWVFPKRRMEASPRMEFAVYFVVGVIGLGVNNLVIFLMVDNLALPLLVSKACAAAATFMFNFVMRKWVLF